MAVQVNQVKVELSPVALDDLADRLVRTRLSHSGTETWVRGTPTSWLADLIADWRAFDPGRLQETLDRLTHIEVALDDITIHAVHAPRSDGKGAPLLLTHGWPSSFLEYVTLLPLLTEPQSNSATPDSDAFAVVVPSLPGFGFSGVPPESGLDYGAVAEIWHRLMTEVLGYPRYFAHGSDLGAGVTARLARSHPDAVAAIHLATPGLPAPPKPWSDELQEHFDQVQTWSLEEGGYAHMHATKPSTVAAALLDSPAALAAWIGEKWVSWSAPSGATVPFSAREHLLSTLTLYWVTGTAGSSMLPYWNYQHGPNGALPADDPAPTPTAVDVFGGEAVPFPKPPRELAERYFNVVRWAEHPRGGHFPAVAEPHLLAQCLRDAFRPHRSKVVIAAR